MFKDRKKIIPIFILVFVFAITALSFYFIGRSSYGINQIAYGKKYVRYDYISNFRDGGSYIYYVINSNGTLYKESADSNNMPMYRKTYRYEIMDDGTMMAFYDDYERFDGLTNSGVVTDETLTILFSRNVILLGGTTVYVCEDYIDNIPNFDEPYNP